MTAHRFRFPAKGFDIGFVFGTLSASALPGPVLIRLLGALGTHESAARNAVTTMTARGMLISERHGRVALYRLASGSLARYRQIEGTNSETAWTGSFHGLLYDVPERHRAYRDRLRYVADAAGYGLLRPGVLISSEDRRDRLGGVVEEQPRGCRFYSIGVQTADLAQARRMAEDTWDLKALAGQYRRAEEQVVRIEATAPSSWQDGLVRWHGLYTQLLTFQLADPALPRELLPERWPRATLVQAMEQLNRHWAPRLQQWIRDEATAWDPDGLADYYTPPWAAAAVNGSRG